MLVFRLLYPHSVFHWPGNTPEWESVISFHIKQQKEQDMCGMQHLSLGFHSPFHPLDVEVLWRPQRSPYQAWGHFIWQPLCCDLDVVVASVTGPLSLAASVAAGERRRSGVCVLLGAHCWLVSCCCGSLQDSCPTRWSKSFHWGIFILNVDRKTYGWFQFYTRHQTHRFAGAGEPDIKGQFTPIPIHICSLLPSYFINLYF